MLHVSRKSTPEANIYNICYAQNEVSTDKMTAKMTKPQAIMLGPRLLARNNLFGQIIICWLCNFESKRWKASKSICQLQAAYGGFIKSA